MMNAKIQYSMIAGALAGLVLVSGARAQTAPHFEGGIGLLGAAAGGEFGELVDGAVGFGANARLRLDAQGNVALRADADWMMHGWDRRDVDLRSPFGGVRSAELRSNHSVSFLQLGPEVSARLGRVRPYLSAEAGLAYFLTAADADEKEDATRFAIQVEHHDLAFAYGAHTGLRIPVGTSKHPVAVDLGLRYQHTNEADFLRKGDLTVDDAGAIHFSPVRAEANLWVFHAGISVPLTRSKKNRKDRD
jgi:hypothetical protein